MIRNFDISKLSYDIYRYDNGTYCARFCYPDDNGDSLSVNFEFSDYFYREHLGVCSFFTLDSFRSNGYQLAFIDYSTDSFPCCYYVELPTVYGYRSRRGKWLRSGAHHTRLIIDFKKLFAF